MTARQLASFTWILQGRNIDRFHHGCCVGADEQAANMVFKQNASVFICEHPPVDMKCLSRNLPTAYHRFEAKPYLERDHYIVDSCTLLIAAPRTRREETRS